MTLSIKARAAEAGLRPNTVYNRLHRGWDLDTALTRPAMRKGVVLPKALAHVRTHPGCTAREVATAIGEPHEIVRVALWQLVRAQVLVTDTTMALVSGRATEIRQYRENPD